MKRMSEIFSLPGSPANGTCAKTKAECIYTTCKVCQGGELKTVYTSRREKSPILCCRNCGLFFVGSNIGLEERYAIYQDEGNYLEYVNAKRSVNAVGCRYDRLLRQILKYNTESFGKRKWRLLDIGCGAGDLLAVAEQLGFDPYGLEISVPAAQLAAKSHNIDVAMCEIDAYDPPFRFEAITLISVLEHVGDPKAMLVNAQRLLAPGGILYIYTPVWGWYDRLASFTARISRSRFTQLIDRRISGAHLQIFPKTTLLLLMQNIGLRVSACEKVCEYNLPIQEYLKSIGIGGAVQTFLTSLIETLASRKCFFRNNIRVFAAKPGDA